jgi:hypothetical protein
MLDRSLRAVQATRTEALRRAGQASTGAAVGSELDRIRTVFRRAAQTLARADLSPQIRPANTAVVRALRSAGSAYGAMAAAARDDDGADYAAGARRVRSEERRLGAALEELRALGYGVR